MEVTTAAAQIKSLALATCLAGGAARSKVLLHHRSSDQSSAAAGNAALGSSGGAADVSNAWERPSAAAHPVQATAPLT